MVIADRHLAIIVRTVRVGPVVTLFKKEEVSMESSLSVCPQAFLADCITIQRLRPAQTVMYFTNTFKKATMSQGYRSFSVHNIMGQLSFVYVVCCWPKLHSVARDYICPASSLQFIVFKNMSLTQRSTQRNIQGEHTKRRFLMYEFHIRDLWFGLSLSVTFSSLASIFCSVYASPDCHTTGLTDLASN